MPDAPKASPSRGGGTAKAVTEGWPRLSLASLDSSPQGEPSSDKRSFTVVSYRATRRPIDDSLTKVTPLPPGTSPDAKKLRSNTAASYRATHPMVLDVEPAKVTPLAHVHTCEMTLDYLLLAIETIFV